MDRMNVLFTKGDEEREITFVGRSGSFQEMLSIVKAIPGATFVGKVREYGELHTYNRWTVPFSHYDAYWAYGPFADLFAISYMEYEEREIKSEDRLEELLIIGNEPSPHRAMMQEAYRIGRDSGEEPTSANVSKWLKVAR